MEMYKQLPINIREVSLVGPLQFYSTQVILCRGRGVQQLQYKHVRTHVGM